MPVAQWILYDQCNLRYINPEVTDIFFILFTGSQIASPTGNLSFNIRSKIAEYAIAKAFLADCVKAGYRTHWIEAESYTKGIEQFIVKTSIINIISMRSSEEYLARKIEKYILQRVYITIFPNRQFLITEEEF
jgi:Deoxyribodipyrimidine photo-lyase-related protein